MSQTRLMRPEEGRIEKSTTIPAGHSSGIVHRTDFRSPEVPRLEGDWFPRRPK